LRTPNLSRLARDGVTFSRGYSDCPVCVPARVTVMSGNHAVRHGLILNGKSSTVLGDSDTLPARLRGLGYQTVGIGKMHFGPTRTRHGFDETILPHDYVRDMERSGNPLQPFRNGIDANDLYPALSTVPEPLTLTSWIAERCHDFLTERQDPTRPFFLWCSFVDPHPPLDPPEPYYSMYLNDPIPEPTIGGWEDDERCPPTYRRWVRTWSSDQIPPTVIRKARAAYYGLVTQIDYNIGRILEALQLSGQLENTMIVFTSDHGEHLGDHRGLGKVFPFESCARVPYIVRPPKSWETPLRGKTTDELVCLADLLPTFVGAAGGRAVDVDGSDLTDLVMGSGEAVRDDLEICCSSFETQIPGRERGEPAYFSLFDGRYKYVWYPEGGFEQLFDVENDPTESFNLVEEAGNGVGRRGDNRATEMHRTLAERVGRRDSNWSDGRGLTELPVGDDTEEVQRANRTPTWITTQRTRVSR
jgi:arylsulfatase A-like enzyme